MLGESWQGVPFGVSLSDNLFQILIIYIFLLIFGGKELMAKSEQSAGVIGKASYRKFAITALVLSLIAFVLLGRIDVSTTVIEVLSYSILASLFLAYTVLYLKAKNS